MAQRIKILVAGIGGVGGYFGGLLAKIYENSNEVDIIFLARGEHLNQIQNNGLKVISESGEFSAKPHLATDNASEIGIVDYVIICTKSYDLEATIEQIKPCVGEHTILLPLLNGVDAAERIKEILPDATVAEGCVYIISRLKEAGVVENKGNIQSLFFGLQNKTNDKLILLEKLLKDAGVEAILSDNISSIVWEKFIFISAIATATSYFDTCIGKLLEEHEAFVLKLIDEVKQVAIARGVSVAQDITEKTVSKLKSMPYAATSSMHSDYQNQKHHTEVESLTGYVVKAGKELHIPTPTYNQAYQYLTKINHNYKM